MRFKIKIGKDTVLALKEVENILQATSEQKFTRGELMASAWNTISPIKDSLNWLEISKIDINTIISQDYNVTTGINTTFNIEDKIIDALKQFQISLVSDFEQLVYLPYAIKLVLVATILKEAGTLDQFKK